jgi:hypothetical protein
MKNKKNKLPGFMELGHADYVKHRFEELPAEAKKFFELSSDMDARAHLEVSFRAEWYRKRHDQMQALMLRAYKKYLATKTVLRRLQVDAGMKTEDLDELLLEAFLSVGEIDQIPWDF